MSRVKTFDSTGLATAGRLYAGDLNAIQDQYADLVNLAQSVSVGSLAVGEAGLQLVRYGAGEGRITGMLRTDGILRGLGGLYAGAFTTTQRDAIPAGSRPYGLEILNSTTNQREWNKGTDAAPNWQPVSAGYGAGVILDFAGPGSSIPPLTALTDGAQYSQTGPMAALYAKIGNNWNTFRGLPAPSAGNFRVPDLRGLGTVGHVSMDSGAAPTITGVRITAASSLYGILGEELHTLTIPEIPSHDHGAATGVNSVDHTHTGTTGTESADHTHSGTTAGDNVDHYHVYTPPAGTGAGSGSSDALATTGSPAGTSGVSVLHAHNYTTGGRSAAHTHFFTSSGASVTHTHAITAQGGGGAHQNVHPVAVVNKVITIS